MRQGPEEEKLGEKEEEGNLRHVESSKTLGMEETESRAEESICRICL